jgi:hypothetical protein
MKSNIRTVKSVAKFSRSESSSYSLRFFSLEGFLASVKDEMIYVVFFPDDYVVIAAHITRRVH